VPVGQDMVLIPRGGFSPNDMAHSVNVGPRPTVPTSCPRHPEPIRLASAKVSQPAANLKPPFFLIDVQLDKFLIGLGQVDNSFNEADDTS